MTNEQARIYSLLNKLDESRYFSLLNTNAQFYKSDRWKLLCGCSDNKIPLSQLQTDQLAFGHVSYDYKNQIENLTSSNLPLNGFNDLSFFQADYWLGLGLENEIKGSPELINPFNEKQIFNLPELHALTFSTTTSKDEYFDKFDTIQKNLRYGNIYEVNLCIGYKAEDVKLDPLALYVQLNNITPTPFSCIYKNASNYLICASPERYLKKSSTKLTSQPIKGTYHRDDNESIDALNKLALSLSLKDIAENTMVVDMVRNDLSRIAEPNTVTVEELCEVYSFPKVHQMISTISCEISDSTSFEDIINATFPMGSMTGTPKISAMKLIEVLENQKRGLFSGTIGYIDQTGDFDFNVVIRSLFYNSTSKNLSFQVGGAITLQSDPEQEYEECMLKAEAIFELFNVIMPSQNPKPQEISHSIH